VLRLARLALCAVGLGLAALAPTPAAAVYLELTPQQVEEAVETGRASIMQEEFGQEWVVRLPGGEEVQVTTPFARVALAARLAAFKGEPLAEKEIQTHRERGKGRIQFLVAVHGPKVDFARWYEAVLRLGQREVKTTFSQNERTALRLEDGRYLARNIYVFPTEGLPPRGAVTLLVRTREGKEVLRVPIDLGAMR